MNQIPEAVDILHNRIQATKQEIIYWQRQQLLRTERDARIQAGARVLIWESQLRVLTAQLQATLTQAA